MIDDVNPTYSLLKIWSFHFKISQIITLSKQTNNITHIFQEMLAPTLEILTNMLKKSRQMFFLFQHN